MLILIVFKFVILLKDIFVNYFVTVDCVLLNIMPINSLFFDRKSEFGHDLVIISNICVDNFVHGL